MHRAIAVAVLLFIPLSAPTAPSRDPVVTLRIPHLAPSDVPDVFSASFLTAIDRGVATAVGRKRPASEYVSEERSRWMEAGRKSILERFLNLPPDSPGRLRAEAFLRDQGDPDHTLNEREKERFAELVAREYFGAWVRAVRAAAPRSRYVGGRFSTPPPAAVLKGMREALRKDAGKMRQ